MRLLTIPTEHLFINPMRNLEINPLQQPKLDKLKWSMDNLKFWENLVVRPKDNTIHGQVIRTQDELDALLEKMWKDGQREVDFPVEAAYGAHRIEAFKMLNQDRMEYNKANKGKEKALLPDPCLPIKIIDDNAMLQMMIEENQSTWQHSTSTLVENVEQVFTTIQNQLEEFTVDQFDEFYSKYKYFISAESFKQAKGTRGVGPDTIYRFLGFNPKDKESMKDAPKEDEIRGPVNAIKWLSKNEWFDRKNLYVLPTASHLRFGIALVEAIQDYDNTKIPKLVKDRWIKNFFQFFKDDDQLLKTPSVTVVKLAKSRLENEAAQPISYIKAYGKTTTPFNIKAELAIIFDEKGIYTEEDAIKMADGFKGFEGMIPDVVAAAKRKKDVRDGVVTPKSKAPTGQTNTTTQKVSEGTSDTSPMPTPNEVKTSERPAEMTIAATSNVIKGHYGSIMKFANRLAEDSEEVDAGDDALFKGAGEVIESLLDMVDAVLGRDHVIDKLNELLDAYNDEDMFPSVDTESELDIQPTPEPEPEPTPEPEPVEEVKAVEKAEPAPAPKKVAKKAIKKPIKKATKK